MAEIIAALNAGEYGNSKTRLNNLSGMTTTTTYEFEQVQSVLGETVIANEAWLSPSTIKTQIGNTNPIVNNAPGDIYEIHMIYHAGIDSTTFFNTILQVRAYNSSSAAELRLYGRIQPHGAYQRYSLTLHRKPHGLATTHIDLGFPLVSKQTLYIVMRVQGQTQKTSGSNLVPDGKVEIWVNGKLTYTDNTFQFSSNNLTFANLKTGVVDMYTATYSNPAIVDRLMIRDCAVLTGTTTPFGTAPIHAHNVPMPITSTTETNMQVTGAASGLLAIGDDDDASNVSNTNETFSIKLNVTPDAGIATKQASDIIVQHYSNTPDFTSGPDLKTSIQTIAGTEIDSDTKSISPSDLAQRSIILEPTTTPLNDIQVVIEQL